MSQTKLLVKFSQNDCPGCRRIEPVINAMKEADVFNDHNVMLHEINLDSVPSEQRDSMVEEYKLSSVPTMILFEGEREIGRVTGVMGGDEIEEFIATADTEVEDEEEGDEDDE